MASFLRVPVPPGTTTDKLGQMVLKRLARGYSVEVTGDATGVSELRVWDGGRQHGSNETGADAGKDY